MKKRVLSLILCLSVFMVSGISAFGYGESFGAKVLLDKTNAYELYNPQKGTAWLADQSAVEAAVAAAQDEPEEDMTVYNFARQSTIVYLGENVAWANGYEVYILPENKHAVPFTDGGTTYIPLSFASDYIDIDLVANENSGVDMTVSDGEETKLQHFDTLIKDDIAYIPLRAVCEASDKTVLYDNRGIIVITTADGAKLLTQDIWDDIASDDFTLDRDKVMHPLNEDIMRWCLNSGDRTTVASSLEAIDAGIAPYMEMSYSALAAYVEKEVKTNDSGAQRHIGERPKFENAVLMMAARYDDNPSEDLALRIIIMGYYSAIHFDELATYTWNDFYDIEYVTPIAFVYASERIYHAKAWDIFKENFGFDAMEVFRLWWETVYNYLVANLTTPDGGVEPVGNYPIFIGHLSGLAYTLDEPDMMRRLIDTMDKASSPDSFYADGMWYEGSFDYGNQMVGNSEVALKFLDNYTDPLDYVDTTHGVRLGGKSITAKWQSFFNYVKSLNAKAYYPDGSRVAVNDTHWTDVAANMGDNTIKEQYLSDNIELNHFGLFGLRYGDTEEAQQLNLTLTPTTEVSHEHASYLAISYYSGGVELLPDQGYVTPSDLHRYSLTPVFGHNAASAWAPGGGLADGTFYTRPNVLAYDDGHANDKQIQLIEADVPMQADKKIDVNKRTLMMVATDKNHSYVVDIQRIKGAITPEAYLVQPEDESVELTTNLKLGKKYDGMLSDWAKKNEAYGGEVNSYQFARVIVNPEGTKTDDDFYFSWKGDTSGTSLNAFIKGNEGQLVAFASYPTVRRTNKDVTKKDDFPGYYFYRRSTESVDKVTTFGGVYEGVKDGADAFVQDVTWIDAPDGDEMTAMVKVELKDSIDYIYSSNDLKERKFENFTFSGNNAFVRVDKASGKVIRSYIYGDGKITDGSYTLTGKENLSYRVINATGTRPSEEVQNNKIKVEGVVPSDIESYWCNVTFPDDSGISYRVESVNESTLTLHNDPGFYVTEEGVTFTAYPLYEDPSTKKVADFAYPYNFGMEQRSRKGEVVLTAKIPSYYSE